MKSRATSHNINFLLRLIVAVLIFGTQESLGLIAQDGTCSLFVYTPFTYE